MDIPTTTGAELREQRREHGITQVEMAAVLEITQQAVSLIELRPRVSDLLSRRWQHAIDELRPRKTA